MQVTKYQNELAAEKEWPHHSHSVVSTSNEASWPCGLSRWPVLCHCVIVVIVSLWSLMMACPCAMHYTVVPSSLHTMPFVPLYTMHYTIAPDDASRGLSIAVLANCCACRHIVPVPSTAVHGICSASGSPPHLLVPLHCAIVLLWSSCHCGYRGGTT